MIKFNQFLSQKYYEIPDRNTGFKKIITEGYAVPYEADTRKVYRIGAVFSSTEGTVSEWKIA